MMFRFIYKIYLIFHKVLYLQINVLCADNNMYASFVIFKCHLFIHVGKGIYINIFSSSFGILIIKYQTNVSIYQHTCVFI